MQKKNLITLKESKIIKKTVKKTFKKDRKKLLKRKTSNKRRKHSVKN